MGLKSGSITCVVERWGLEVSGSSFHQVKICTCWPSCLCHPNGLMLPLPVVTVLNRWWEVPGFHQTWYFFKARNIQSLFFSWSKESLRCFRRYLSEKKLMSGHPGIKLSLVGCCSDGWPAGTLPDLLTKHLELSPTNHQTLGHVLN